MHANSLANIIGTLFHRFLVRFPTDSQNIHVGGYEALVANALLRNDMISSIQLRDGDTLLAVVQDGNVTAHTRDIALSHAEFVKRALGTLPQGAWVGTIRKADGEITAFNSRTFYGNQLPATREVLDAVRGMFR